MMTEMKNMYLVEACRRGDQKAQLQVYKLYFRTMFNISYKMVNNAIAADEIVRESFLFAFDKISTNNRRTDFIASVKSLVEERSMEIWKKSNVTFPGLIVDRALVE